MKIGASSACLYPMETEKAFLHIAQLGFTDSEIFINSRCELERPFLKELQAVQNAYKINIISLHPHSSFAEGYNFFSNYERRFNDGVEDYKRYFEAAAILGAKYIVLHGSNHPVITTEEYAERFKKLNDVALSFGCTVAHENVVRYAGETPEFMKAMKGYLGNEFKTVLDVKQARRAGREVSEFIEAMGNSIVHVHLSDFNNSCDCIPPCEDGHFDFKKLFTELNEAGYSGKYVIELYSRNFSDEKEILKSAKYLEGILNKVRSD